MEQKIGRILSDFSFLNFVGVGIGLDSDVNLLELDSESDWILMLIYRSGFGI